MAASGRFPPEVVRLLETAGWFEGRRVPDSQLATWEAEVAPTIYPMFPSARSALREFGGLTIGESVPGVHLARAAMQFVPELGDDTVQLADLVGGPVYPLGEADGGHGVFGMDAAGCAYLDYLHLIFVAGPSLDELMVRVLLGLEHPTSAVLADLRSQS